MRAEPADRGKTTIVIADDHTVVRQGRRLLVDAEADMQVVAEACDVPDAERLTRAQRPSVLVLDLKGALGCVLKEAADEEPSRRVDTAARLGMATA